jgi:hypothetical protein
MRIGVGLQPTGLTRGEAPGGGAILSVGDTDQPGPAVIDFGERISGFGRLAGTSAETPSNFLNHRKVSTSSLFEVYGPH